MAKGKVTAEFFWVSYPNAYSKGEEKVHNAGCDKYYGKTHGRGLTMDEITPAMVDCRICRGARRG